MLGASELQRKTYAAYVEVTQRLHWWSWYLAEIIFVAFPSSRALPTFIFSCIYSESMRQSGHPPYDELRRARRFSLVLKHYALRLVAGRYTARAAQERRSQLPARAQAKPPSRRQTEKSKTYNIGQNLPSCQKLATQKGQAGRRVTCWSPPIPPCRSRLQSPASSLQLDQNPQPSRTRGGSVRVTGWAKASWSRAS